MAPLDMGHVMNLRLVDPLDDRAGPTAQEYDAVGEFLRAVRLHRGLDLDALAETTRIRRPHLLALEEGDLSLLPSRPFAIGYVRAYAEALGLDGEAAAARFKAETPDFSEPLRNPVGVGHESRRANPLVFAPIALLVAGVVAWNVTQHSMVRSATRSKAPITLAAAPSPDTDAPKGPITLGDATPPPADQTMPAPYVTPGLDLSGSAAPAGAGKPPAPAPAPAAEAPPSPTPNVFTPAGAVYGAGADAPAVIVQAAKDGLLVVRGPGGAVYFARPMKKGEAYRAPLGSGLSLDAPDSDTFAVYLSGRLVPPLVGGVNPVDKLATRKPSP
jgi:transcriptional regulator with XRE-family HTH domain